MSTQIDSRSRRGFLKSMAVGVGACALGSPLIHPKEAMGQSIEDYLESGIQVPLEASCHSFIAFFVYS